MGWGGVWWGGAGGGTLISPECDRKDGGSSLSVPVVMETAEGVLLSHSSSGSPPHTVVEDVRILMSQLIFTSVHLMKLSKFSLKRRQFDFLLNQHTRVVVFSMWTFLLWFSVDIPL